MLRTNLATRPFYNVRAVRTVLLVVTVVVLAITLFNVIQVVRLSATQRTLGASAAAAEAEADRLRQEAARIRAQINPRELAAVSNAAREANEIIDQRSFRWTELFSHLERTLPPEVRITAVRPRYENRNASFIVAMAVEARRIDDLDAFIEALEAEAGFRNVLPVQDRTTEDGIIQAIVEGAYAPPPREALPAGEPPPGGEPQPAGEPQPGGGAGQ